MKYLVFITVLFFACFNSGCIKPAQPPSPTLADTVQGKYLVSGYSEIAFNPDSNAIYHNDTLQVTKNSDTVITVSVSALGLVVPNLIHQPLTQYNTFYYIGYVTHYTCQDCTANAAFFRADIDSITVSSLILENGLYKQYSLTGRKIH